MVLIQEIRSVWSKAARGGAAAVLRNSVAESAPFSITSSKPATHKITRQLLVYAEANDFAEPIKSEVVESEAAAITIGCVKIEILDNGCLVAYEYDYKCGGLPPRRNRAGVSLREEMVVEPGCWVRVRYNGRFRGDEWWYEKVVVNVGMFEKPDADVFTLTEPVNEISQMAELR